MLWLRRIGSALAIGVISLILLEMVLQLGSVVVRWTGRDAPFIDQHQNGIKVLTLGDSHTYGLYYPAERAWPARFEALWNQAHPASPISLINLGYPGTNSYRVRANIEGIVQKTSPDWVFLMIGYNDFWTPAENLDQSQIAPGAFSWLDVVRKYSRVYRLFYMLQQDYRGHVVESKMRFRLPDSVLNDPEKLQAFLDELSKNIRESQRETEKEGKTIQADKHPEISSDDLIIDGERFPMFLQAAGPPASIDRLPDNLGFIAGKVRDNGAKLVLLTYPTSGHWYPQASDKLRQFANDNDIPLIDLEQYFKGVCQGDVKCFQYFLRDAHLNDKGYELAGQYVSDTFARILESTH